MKTYGSLLDDIEVVLDDIDKCADPVSRFDVQQIQTSNFLFEFINNHIDIQKLYDCTNKFKYKYWYNLPLDYNYTFVSEKYIEITYRIVWYILKSILNNENHTKHIDISQLLTDDCLYKTVRLYIYKKYDDYCVNITYNDNTLITIKLKSIEYI